jgi:hypothetical protein
MKLTLILPKQLRNRTKSGLKLDNRWKLDRYKEAGEGLRKYLKERKKQKNRLRIDEYDLN